MKLKLKDNKTWIKEEREKRKRRILTIMVMLIILAAAASALILNAELSIRKGKFYPVIALADTPTGEEPLVRSTNGFDKIIKCPNLPYTMIVAGDLVAEGSSFCVFQYEGYYISVCEVSKNAQTEDVLANILLPGLNGQVAETQKFNEQEGYLNERHIQTFGATVKLLDNKKLYTLNYRILLGGDTDIYLCGINRKAQMQPVQNILDNVFYSFHELTEKDITDNVAMMNMDIEGISAQEESDMEDWPLDEDTLQEGETYDPTSYASGVRKKQDNVIYARNEEAAVNVTEDYEHACFVFSYEIDRELDSILLYDPDGDNFYFPEFYDYYFEAEYVFFIDQPIQGEWKFVYNAGDEIGYYRTQIMDAADYKKGEERY